MSTPLPPDTQLFSDRQRRQLSQVYSLILSWRNEAKQKDIAKVTVTEKPKKGSVVVKISNQTGGDRV